MTVEQVTEPLAPYRLTEPGATREYSRVPVPTPGYTNLRVFMGLDRKGSDGE